MSKIYSHGNCDFYNPKWDECKKFHESNMSKRVRLCECSMRNGGDEE